ncbi:MAG: GNAT family N-acetyltransferase [Clostridia bacterium]|nr:GNAT family N-acetyltransferase [Clostridia bacterium]
MVTIRRFTIDDYDAVFELWMACPEMELNDTDDSREGVARFLARNPDTAWVAQEDGRVVGVLMVGTDGRRGYVYHAGVDPACRGKGIGSALADTALDTLREMGLSKAGLLAFADNRPGIEFWERHGFVRREDLSYLSCVLGRIQRIEH